MVREWRWVCSERHGQLCLVGRLPPAVRVSSSAGKKHSIRISCSVMSCGVPRRMTVEKKRKSWRPQSEDRGGFLNI
jgi:hypothetical protein